MLKQIQKKRADRLGEDMEEKSDLKWASCEPTSMDFYLITKFEGWLPGPFRLDPV